MKRILFICMLIILSGQTSMASWNFQLAMQTEYNDNPFRLPQAEDSWIAGFEFGAQRDFGNLFISYFGDVNQFQNMTDRNFYWHQLGFGGGDDTTRWGLYGENRMNKQDYNVYDYTTLTAYLQHQFQFIGFTASWKGAAEWNRYQVLAELNNYALNSSLQLRKTFPTKTTVMSGISLIMKQYTSQESVVFDSISALQGISEISILGNGRGNGGRGGHNGGYLSSTSYTAMESASVSHLSSWFRVAQSLTQTTGLSMQYQLFRQLSGSDRFVAGIASSYGGESLLYDDPLSYEGYALRGELTQLLPWGVIMKLSSSYGQKKYVAQGLYLDELTYDAYTLREDWYTSVIFSLRKNFELTFSEISLYLSSYYLNNESNSFWYRYKNRYANIGLEFQL